MPVNKKKMLTKVHLTEAADRPVGRILAQGTNLVNQGIPSLPILKRAPIHTLFFDQTAPFP